MDQTNHTLQRLVLALSFIGGLGISYALRAELGLTGAQILAAGATVGFAHQSFQAWRLDNKLWVVTRQRDLSQESLGDAMADREAIAAKAHQFRGYAARLTKAREERNRAQEAQMAADRVIEDRGTQIRGLEAKLKYANAAGLLQVILETRPQAEQHYGPKIELRITKQLLDRVREMVAPLAGYLPTELEWLGSVVVVPDDDPSLGGDPGMGGYEFAWRRRSSNSLMDFNRGPSTAGGQMAAALEGRPVTVADVKRALEAMA